MIPIPMKLVVVVTWYAEGLSVQCTQCCFCCTGGPGYTVKAEFNARKHVRGSVAMARSQDPDSAGSQFYITYGAQPHLDGSYTVFGQVRSGMEHVDGIRQGDRMRSVAIDDE